MNEDYPTLAARPLLEQVAKLGECIGQHTVGEIRAISSRAAAWLEENPPGQPVAKEPRGCPTPGACSCMEPAPPAEGEVAEVAELVRWLRSRAGIPASGDFPAVIAYLTRAADLLELQQPVPPAEREAPTDEQLYDLAAEYDGESVESMRAALAQWGNVPPPAEEKPRLTVQEISELREHGASYICEIWTGEIELDGYFTRAQLRQLADSIPTEEPPSASPAAPSL